MGGIPTNINAEVVVDNDNNVLPGLYAAGECACVSVHGANRLGTNSLLDIVVFGRRGGRALLEYVRAVDHAEPPPDAADEVRGRIERLKASTGDERVARVRADLQEAMMEGASVFRTDASLTTTLTTIADLRARYERVAVDDRGEVFNFDVTEALELGYLLDLAECVVVSARARTESRGAHARDDHPGRDDANWMRHTLVSRDEAGRTSLAYKPVAGGKYEHMERKY